MKKDDMIDELLAEAASDADYPPVLRAYFEEILRSFSAKEIKLLHANMDRFTMTCEDDEIFTGEAHYGKLFFKEERPLPTCYFVNVFPQTLDELKDSPEDIKYVMCHELGHLYLGTGIVPKPSRY